MHLESWISRNKSRLESTATLYMIEQGLFKSISGDQYEIVKQAFLAGYCKGLNNRQSVGLDILDEQQKIAANQARIIEQRRWSLKRQINTLRKAKEEILEMKRALKEGFAIKQVE